MMGSRLPLRVRWGRGNWVRGEARRGGPAQVEWTHARVQALEEARQAGKTWGEIGRALGVSQTSARRKGAALGLAGRDPGKPVWTDGAVERLVALARVGKSPREIADELEGFSRNAVIGKLHRLRKLEARDRGAI